MVNHIPMFYDPKNVKEAKTLICDCLKPHVPAAPIEGPVKLTVVWMFESKSHKSGTWRVTRPDTDNLQKALKDCMTRTGFWKDDSLVVHEEVKKLWFSPPGIYIKIEELDDAISR